MEWRKGDLVVLNGLLAVVVGVVGDNNVPEDHVALWYGQPPDQHISAENSGKATPEIYTVPAEYCRSAPEPVYIH